MGEGQRAIPGAISRLEAFRGSQLDRAGGLSLKQRRKHAKLLRLFAGHQVTDIIAHIEQQARLRNWGPSTIRTEIGAVFGASKRFRKHAFPQVRGDPLWSDFVAEIEELLAQHRVNFPKAVPKYVVRTIIDRLLSSGNNEHALFLAICWATTQRPKCCALLLKENVALDSHDQVRIRFVAGKAVYLRKQPYTIFSSLPKDIRSVLADQLDKNPQNPKLFDLPQNQLYARVKSQLKAAGFKDIRGLRRGSLQELAKVLPLNELLHFSGHRSITMLKRYLDWGWLALAESHKLRQASKQLW